MGGSARLGLSERTKHIPRISKDDHLVDCEAGSKEMNREHDTGA
jgi:hypothetical protein